MSYQLFRVGKRWHYRFQVNGARVQRSTRESVKHKAEAVAARAYHDAKLWSRGREPVPTLRELFVKWIAANEPIVSGAHIKSMRTVARLHLYGLGDVSVDQLTNGAIEQARLEHLQTHSRASANHWLKSIKVVCNWAVRRNILPMVPWSVKLIKLQKRPRTTLPASMASKWLIEVDAAAARQPGVSIAVRLMLGLGLREMETITARWEWLDWERGTYTPGRTKGREADPVPVPQWLLDYLQPTRQACGLIVTRTNGEACKAGFTRRAMFAANTACEVVGLTPHRLRGTFATLLSEQGVPIQTIRRVMRHKDPRTTMVYLEADLGSVVDAQARLSEKMGLADAPKRKVSGEEVAKDTVQTRAVTEFADSCVSSAQGAESGARVITKPSTS
ncbi:site-specific integrase [Caballeronia sp. LZ001]|uniref:tyrosine-type recombinase/integrase n=1 Tax=Caballeronia sp. LZ001 TaxID=3038553 RepID=UPI002856B7F5|nr:site-specific integrase [Caballeronia sp. LZ001]MDR5800651.1 site-specific integrase [Caballeronia sp. LZ001]